MKQLIVIGLFASILIQDTSLYSAEKNMHHSPHAKLSPVGYDDVQWTDGFWAKRFDMIKDVTIQRVWEALNDTNNSAGFRNFRIAAGLEKGKPYNTHWSDGDCYKWMEAALRVYNVTKDEELLNRVDELIELIGKAQESDGYLNTQITIPGRKRWIVKRYHEDYNLGHLFTSASVHFEITGKTAFLEIAEKAATCLEIAFKTNAREYAHFGWNPSHVMGLVDLYRATNKKKYLDLADFFMTLKGSHPEDFRKADCMMGNPCTMVDGGDQNQDRVPLRKETIAVGHVITAMYLYSGAADIYSETGEKAILDALTTIWKDVVYRKMYITGGAAALYRGSSKRRDSVHEAFGFEYQLPNANAYMETGSNISNAMFNWRLLNITGEAQYADVMETVLYNSYLSGISIDGKEFFYCNPLRYSGNPHHLSRTNDVPSRWYLHNCFCCPPQIARSHAWISRWTYSIGDEGLWINIYSGNKLNTKLKDGSSIELTQETDYPWDGKISITIRRAPSKPFAVMLRIPSWLGGQENQIQLSINGQRKNMQFKSGTHVELKRKWVRNDKIELVLPMQSRLMQANPEVEEVRNQVAVKRGPVVYCLEGVDLPQNIDVSQVHIPRDIQLKSTYQKDLLGGVVTLQGYALTFPRMNWDKTLYRPLVETKDELVPIQLIPYYAWANRGVHRMTVWMPVVR